MSVPDSQRTLLRTPLWQPAADVEAIVRREWLVTNGRGGYASSTIAGVNTRRYHGVLVAALPAPLGRCVMLNHLHEELGIAGRPPVELTAHERGGGLDLRGAAHLESFSLDGGLPVWCLRVDDWLLEKRVLMPHEQNTTHISYRVLQAGTAPARLRLRPALHFRSYEDPVDAPLVATHRASHEGTHVEVLGDASYPALRMRTFGAAASFLPDTRRETEIVFRVEAGRGYQSVGELWSPGEFVVELDVGASFTLAASTENRDDLDALDPAAALDAERHRRASLIELARVADDPVAAELVLAADQFIITPTGRAEEAARAHAAGEEVRTVIAGYHWFTDWGRDTMISLEGLTLATHRYREGGYILRTFARYVRDGLIPNMFPDGSAEGLYHTADATLWFFHAARRYFDATGDEHTMKTLLPTFRDIVEHHVRGTRFGIGVDPADGLLRQGAEGYQLTWMDAKVDDWVVTPRRGKAVELNALWYNALRVLEEWERAFGNVAGADRCERLARQAYDSFNVRFWIPDAGYLYDVVDGEAGDDPACRPNQVFAISLDHPVLAPARWAPVIETVRARLLTPVGLRSLAPGHPDYKPRYYGDLRTRDGAYHQGTVWGWLIGHFVDAWLRVHPERRAEARAMLQGLLDHLDEFGVGSVAEIFDADPPFTPRGCIAQAWSVAELLRCWRRVARDEGARTAAS
ncbi:MAG TPA: amylo-alpha-1,6-glucosidase [Longimicrobiales bacterium]|nr:amylo-alpha-1,6-glucosidase [Longimicrobiales bacterium]